MRKLVSCLFIIIGIFYSLTGCDLFNPGLGNNVDLEAPQVFVTSHPNGAYVRGAITLKGNFLEDVALASIGVSFDNGSSFTLVTLNQAARTWSIDVDTTSIPDGEVDVLFRITDNTAKQTDKKILLYIDNSPPLVMMTVPYNYGGSFYYYGAAYTIRGEAADAFGLQNIQVRILDNAGTLLAAGTATGNNTWYYTFNSETYIPATGTLKFEITATDRAGNVSSKYYHATDAYRTYTTLVGPHTIDYAYQVYSGQVENPVLKNYLDTSGTTPIPINFDQSFNKPTIEVFNPDPDLSATQNVFTANARLSGKATDPDTIKVGSLAVYIDKVGDPSWKAAWTSTNITEINAGTESVSWSYPLPGLVDAEYMVMVRARDIYGNERVTNAYGFTVNSGAPSLTVNQPLMGAYINGNIIVSGSAEDMQGIKRVQISYSTDNGMTYSTPQNAIVNYPNWTYALSSPPEGSLLIRVSATENTIDEKTSSYTLQVIVDRTNPTVDFLDPAFSSTNNGLVHIKGFSSDNTQITKVELRIGDATPASWIQMSNNYNWDYEIDSTNYATAPHSQDIGNGVWKLTIYARVTDRAGNVKNKNDYYFLIDNDRDKPTVSILAPKSGEPIGGSTVVAGNASDDDCLYKVYMSLDLDNDGSYNHSYDLNDDGIKGGTPVGNVAGYTIGNPAEPFENEAYWYELSGTTQWSVELNSNGELYHVNGQNGQITIQVVAVDSKDGGATPSIKGNVVTHSIRFDDTIPGFENMSHDSSSYVHGTFTLSGRAVDDQHVAKIEISYNGGVNWDPTSLYNPPSFPWFNSCDFSKIINTETYFPRNQSSSGILYLRLRATDNTGYQKLQLIDLKVDNSYPTGTLTSATDNIYGTGATSRIQGTATDSGAVSGIDRIEIYFTRGSGPSYTYLSPRGGTRNTSNTINFQDGNGYVPYIEDIYKSNYVVTLNSMTELGSDAGGNGDSDGYDESLTLSGSTYNWWVQFTNTTDQLTDGALTIHYVVYDKAGNGHYYNQAGYIKNNKPVISDVTVGTDLNMNGNTGDTNERFAYTGNFKARNRIYFGITASDPNGSIANYEVRYPNASGILVQASASGEIDISGYPEGATTFVVRVKDNTDTTGIWVEQTINVTIENNDNINPVVQMAALTQSDRANYSLSGGPATRAGDTLLRDAALTGQAFITPGQVIFVSDGSGNTTITTIANWDRTAGTITLTDQAATDRTNYTIIVGGHIEPAGASPYSGAADADVSGTVILRGHIHDNQRVKNVKLYIENQLTETILATWPETNTAGTYKGLIVSNVTLTEAGGHDFDWSYAWNTAGLSTRTGTDIEVRITAEDFRSGTPGSYSVSRDHDVVPYISEVGTQLSPFYASKPSVMNRTALGHYPVRRGDTVNIYGYNFDGTNTNFTINGVSAGTTTNVSTTTQVRITIPTGATSGALLGTVTGLPTINNLNADTNPGNLEPNNINNNTLNDDRFLDVWGFTMPYNNASITYPIMRVNPQNTTKASFSFAISNNFYTMKDEAAPVSFENAYNNYYWNNLGFDTTGNFYAVSSNGSHVGDNWAGAARASFYSRILPQYTNNLGGGTGNAVGQYKRQFETNWNGSIYNSFRIENYDLFVTGAGTDADPAKFYLVYLDNTSHEVRYRFGQQGTAADTITGSLANASTGVWSAPNYHTIGSTYTSIPAIAAVGGTAVAVWYSSDAQTLYYTYNTDPAGTSTAQWAANSRVLDNFGGQTADIAVDAGGGIHIAYYSASSGDLKYAYLSSYAATPTIVTIDSFLSTGANLMIQVRQEGGNYVPYISYYFSSFVDTKACLKMAYRNFTEGMLGSGASLDLYTKKWEVTSVPTNSIPKNYTVSLGFISNLPAVGFVTTNGLEYGQKY